MLDQEGLPGFLEALKKLDTGFSELPAQESRTAGIERIAEVLNATAERLQDNYPYFHPLYAGQMLKPPHAVARLAYALAMWINPNNHALDGGRATSAMEKEAVACDARGRMDTEALTKRVARGDVGTVVTTMGTTATGSVDPLPEILALREKHGFRIHADAAYGGYFMLAENLQQEATRAFSRITEADSIVIDPHKHGLQPYGCGCVLFRDSGVGRLYKHDSPYTYFSSAQLHLGEISLECSRPGAAAAALWATQKLLPLEKGGEFAKGLEQGRNAAVKLFEKVRADSRFVAAFAPELDIVVFAPRAGSVTESSMLTRKIFEAAAGRNLHLAVAELPILFWEGSLGAMKRDRDTIACLRSVLMKPEHYDWVERIWELLSASTQEVLDRSH